MKKHLSFLSALFIAATLFLAPGASTAFAKGGPPWARGGDDHGRRHGHERDDHEWKNRGQRKKWARENGRYRFDDDDRRSVDFYFRDHRGYFRERWRGEGPPLAYGYVIERPYREYCRPVPVALYDELPPPPPGLRYFVLGSNVVLVDDGYRVQDFIHIGINFGL
ncbi:MAG: hypothetical protein ACM3NO_11250 [Deltaproteobacteria bacterium]